MANDSRLWIQHIEHFIDSSSSIEQQDSNLDAVASLLKDDVISIEAVVKEMEHYLTTTDNTLRSKGILFLGKLLERLEKKSLNKSTFCSLIAFFSERLADWNAIQGVLLGSLALVKRKGVVGTALGNEVRSLLGLYLRNIQVQSLGQYDRKLCFQLLKYILDLHHEDCSVLGDDLIYGVCESIDGEKDPDCLLLVFSIVESLARIFPDKSGPLSRFSGELFEILGCYFPIHYTHPQGERFEVIRDDMANALMMAMSSTYHFEPFCIPLLLEKLSSSLPLEKIDSLKYLRCCIPKYGVKRMKKHTQAIWDAIKRVITTSIQGVDLSIIESAESWSFQDDFIALEALGLLSDLMKLNGDLFYDIIISEEDIIKVTADLHRLKSFSDIPCDTKKKLYVASCIISCSIRASEVSCGRLLESLFTIVMDDINLPNRETGVGICNDVNNGLLCREISVGVLFICKEILYSCREVVVNSLVVHDSWKIVVNRYHEDLIDGFNSILVLESNDSIDNMDFIVGVTGLQILATFPKNFLNISKVLYEQILEKIISVILICMKKPVLWRSAVDTLVKIGHFCERNDEFEKASSYMRVVVDKIICSMFSSDTAIDISKKLEILFEVGTSGMWFFSTIIQSLEGTILSGLFEVYVRGNMLKIDFTTQCLNIYSNKLIPWFQKNGGSEDIPKRFAINIWNVVESNELFPVGIEGKELLETAMMALKVSIALCSEETQTQMVEKASISVLSNITPFFKKYVFILPTFRCTESRVSSKSPDALTYRDAWLVSWYASVIMALYPQTRVPNFRATLDMLMSAFLLGNLPAAQALGSLINKLSLQDRGDMSFMDALDVVLDTRFWNFEGCDFHSALEIDDFGTEIGYNLVNHAIMGLTWIVKGLLLRGHERVKDVTMILLRCLMLGDDGEGAFPIKGMVWRSEDGKNESIYHPVMKYSAEAFRTIMKYSDGCLNEKFHAVVRPIYKQKFFAIVTPIIVSLVVKVHSSMTRLMIYRVFGYVISEVPIPAVLLESKKIIPVILDCLSILSENIADMDLLYSLLLLLSGILTDKRGQEVVADNAHIITGCLIGLITYPHMMLVRETTVQCLTAISGLPHIRVYPMRMQVLRALSKAVDDQKRVVRHEAVKCRNIWMSIVS